MPDDVTVEPQLTATRLALVLGSSTGGVGRHVASIAGRLAERGVRVAVFGPAATEAAFGFTARGATFAPVEIVAGIRPAVDVRAVRRLRTLLVGADVVHAHGLRAGVVAGFAAPRGLPLAVTWHNEILETGARGVVLRRARRWLARRADLTLAVSPDLVAVAESLGAHRVQRALVVAPELADARADPARERGSDAVRSALGVAPGDRLVLAVGRLHPQKGFDVLIEAARRMAGTRVVVRIAGDGPARASLSGAVAMARAAGGDVRLLGHRTDIAQLLDAADVVAMPSRWEGWPLAAAEALRAGKPLVASAVGGLPELAGDAAILVPAGSADALAAGLLRVLDDPRRAAELARRGPARAAAWPDEAAVADDLIRLYRALRPRRSA